MAFLSYRVINKHRYLLSLANILTQCCIILGSPGPFHISLCQHSLAMGAWKFLVDFSFLFIDGNFPEYNLTRARRTYKNIRPDRIVNPSFCLTVDMERLIHPAAFGLNFF